MIEFAPFLIDRDIERLEALGSFLQAVGVADASYWVGPSGANVPQAPFVMQYDQPRANNLLPVTLEWPMVGGTAVVRTAFAHAIRILAMMLAEHWGDRVSSLRVDVPIREAFGQLDLPYGQYLKRADWFEPDAHFVTEVEGRFQHRYADVRPPASLQGEGGLPMPIIVHLAITLAESRARIAQRLAEHLPD